MSVSDEERELLVASTRRLLAKRWAAGEHSDRVSRPEHISGIWRAMCEQGIAALGSDPGFGGLREIILVFEEMGRAACPAPLVGSVVTNLLLRDRADVPSEFGDVRDAMQEGSAAVAICFGAFDGDRAAGSPGMRDGNLQGNASFVEDTQVATHLLVLLDAPGRAVLVPAHFNTVALEATPGLAEPPLATIAFRNVALGPQAVVETDRPALKNVTQVARVCYAARALGAATRAFELAVEHAKVRRQFGQLIGQFQAIQHKLADCLTRIDGTRLALDAAATAFDQQSEHWQTFAASAVAFAGPALRQAMLEAHHVLGAVGYAEEHELPRHFRRVHADVARLGGVSRARAEVADHLLNSSNRD